MLKRLTTIILFSICGSVTAGVDSVELKKNWPDAIKCQDVQDGREWIFRITATVTSSEATVYSAFYANTNRAILSFNPDGTFKSIANPSGSWDCAVNTWSINDIISNKRGYFQFYYQP